ncbi:MAG TPA: hypothetical protein VMS64_23310 [Candidatus Methylomirabilis sp.]|nr:hypothetical protein [Candidatus Methylomirabilis sp.]
MPRRAPYLRLLSAIVLAGLLRVASVNAATPEAGPDVEQPMTPDRVLARLNQTLVWYRQARTAIQVLDAVSAGEDEQMALMVLRRSFETARAQAAALATSGPSPTAQRAPVGPLAARRSELEAAIGLELRHIGELRQRVRAAPAARRRAAESELAAATNRLEFDRTRLGFLKKLEESNISSTDTDADLLQQIRALQESVPELSATTKPPPAASPPATTTSAWGLVHRLIDIHRNRSLLDRLAETTKALEQDIGADRHAIESSIRPIMGQLRGLTSDPSSGGSLAVGQQEFRGLLERGKQLGAVILSLRGEAAVVHRFAGDLDSWRSALDRDRWRVLQSLGVGLIGVAVALAAILVGGALWRVAVGRYVQDGYRQRLLLVARNVVVVAAVTIVLVLHFASELTVLITGLGFAAAGIAFALQNVILALVGYFSMVAPNGIRVGDRVSLQGPFGYVHGEVLEIGLVRIRLRELSGDPLRQTGRIVVFPNSVVFTGSFFKLPASEEGGERPLRVGPGIAA